MWARIKYRLRDAQSAILDQLFPPRCVACRSAGDWLCPACRANMERIDPPYCNRCGRPGYQGVCPHCIQSPLQADGLRSVYYFEGVTRAAIHAFKYRQRRELASYFGPLLDDYLKMHPVPTDAIIPVPLHPSRERERGYNQSLLLARELALCQNIPLWYNGITRTRATAPQIHLDLRERRANVRDAFIAADQVAGARVLVIDDVCTTGATLDACSAALKSRGAESVWGLTLARGR